MNEKSINSVIIDAIKNDSNSQDYLSSLWS